MVKANDRIREIFGRKAGATARTGRVRLYHYGNRVGGGVGYDTFPYRGAIAEAAGEASEHITQT